MRPRIPSLSALMAFSAAAKHLSVTRAASELALTESAVSRQIAQLETQLGMKLFYRIKKRITLTRAGAAYSTRVAQTIERIERDALGSWAMRRGDRSGRRGATYGGRAMAYSGACRISMCSIPASLSM